MNFHFIDWIIFALPVCIVIVVAMVTRKYMKSVADFMTAGRCAGRYLICNASGEAAWGAISAVALFEYLYKAGFSVMWWQLMSAPVGLLIVLTGYVIYRYRESRVMTMAQFFEIRYSKGFRVFAGILTYISGILNFGIFPVVGALFFTNYLGLPQTVSFFGMVFPTHILLMTVFISFTLFYTLIGGQMTIMINDCLEGLLSAILYVVVAITLLCIFSWSHIFTAMSAAPAGQSMLNPFDTSRASDFNLWYVLITIVVTIYGYMSWQGGHAFRGSGANPHEAKMGSILSGWRGFMRTTMLTLLGICAFTFMNHPHYAAQASVVTDALHRISSPQIQSQMRSPVAIAHMLPAGVCGMFCTIMFFAMVAADGSYMHSWGSIFIQDVILPLRKKPFTPQQHIRLLRWSIAGVGIFGFCFSVLYKQTEYILMFMELTAAIIAGLGAAVIGGFYWKKSTNAGAWSALITGSLIATGGLTIQQVWQDLARWLIINASHHPGLHAYLLQHADKFPINGQWIRLIAVAISLAVYVTVSLLTCKENFNLDRMLHRGQYAVETKPGEGQPLTGRMRWKWTAILGFDREFTLGDKLISGGLFAWTMFWFVVFVIGTVWNLISPWPLRVWGNYWHVTGVLLPLVIGVVTTVWFTIGGIKDLGIFFRRLKTLKRDLRDDGMVVNHHNLDEPK